MSKFRQYEFNGNTFISVGGALATIEQYESGLASYAHLFDDGSIKRFGDIIGHKKDLKFTGWVEAHPKVGIFEMMGNFLGVFDDGKRAIDLTNLLEALVQYIEKREVDFANKCIKELLLFTARHDRAMRDEAISIIKTNLKGGNND